MASPPPVVVKVPPATTGGGKGSPWQQFVNYWGKKYPQLKQNAQAVYSAARLYGIDPIMFGALILNESGGNFGIHDSTTGAVGIGQLEPSTFLGKQLPWAPKGSNRPITMADLRDPGTNLRLSAYYFGQMLGAHPEAPYGAYNAGPNASPDLQAKIQAKWQQDWISKWNPKYVPAAGKTSPAGPAGQQVPGGTAPSSPDVPTFNDLYVVGVDKHNKFVTSRDPNKALQYDGAPLTRSAFLSLRDQLTSHFVSYTGQRPSNKQIETFLFGGKKGTAGVTPQNATAWSLYQLDTILSKSKNFTKSPIWKERAIPLQEAVKDYLPQGEKVPAETMRQAVINQWDASTLAKRLQKTPGYLKSNQFKGDVASLANVYSSIMGNPANTSADALTSVRDAALAGWNTDQFAAYLRSQDTYKHSTEFQSKSLDFLSALGLITGARPVMQKGLTNPGPGGLGPATQGAIPSDVRVKGNPNEQYTPLPELGATLG